MMVLTRVRRCILMFVVCAAMVVITWNGAGPEHIALAAGSMYYINTASCSDNNQGTSPTAPWCDFAPVNNHGAFQPGDHILLACGATWTQGAGQSGYFVTLSGSGSLGNPVVLDAYDPNNPSSDQCSARPRVFGNGATSSGVIFMDNPSYWTVSNLEEGNAAEGIYAYYNSLNHDSLGFSNIYVHDVKGLYRADATCANSTLKAYFSAGITIGGPGGTAEPSWSSSQVAITDVTMTNIEGTHNQEGIRVEFCNGVQTTDGQNGHNYIQNVMLQGIYLHDDTGPAPGCSEGISFSTASHVTVIDSIFKDEAGCHTDTGTAAIFFGSSHDLNFTNNIVSNVPDTGSGDETGFDYEYGDTNVRVRDNYIANNAGAGLEVLAIYSPVQPEPSQPREGNFDNEVSDNLFVNNGIGTPSNNNSQAAVVRAGNDIQPTGVISGNLYSGGSGFTGSIPCCSGDFSGFTLTNNQGIANSSSTYNAANGYGGTQGANNWSYQYTSNGGGQWNNLLYDSTIGTWTISGSGYSQGYSLVNQFDEHPGECASCWVARAWTAPTSGVVSIRGRVLKQNTRGGDGVGATITKNGTPIWGRQTIAYNDQVGLATDVDNVSVNAGDVIRFVVDLGGSNNAYDGTSWDPSIVYVSGPVITNGGFETPALGLGGYQYAPSGSSWAFGSGGGISANGSAFTNGNPNAPEGTQVAFIQTTGSLSQVIGGFQPSTTYTLTFAAAQRANCCGAGGEDFQVLLDGTSLGTFKPTSTSYTNFSTTFTTTGGSHTLKFVGLDTAGGDNTVFIDNVGFS